MQILTASFRPCFFVHYGDDFDIWDDLPVPVGIVLAGEIELFVPLMRLLLAVERCNLK